LHYRRGGANNAAALTIKQKSDGCRTLLREVAEMDARTLSRIVGTPAGTLNAWVQRDYVPGMSVNPRGRRRDFDPETALHVAVMAELMPYGLGPEWAAIAAEGAVEAYLTGHPVCWIAYLKNKTEKKWELQVEEPPLDPNDRPDVYTVINIARIAEKIQKAEAEYQSSRKARGARAEREDS
jgi:hypothetical protein